MLSDSMPTLGPYSFSRRFHSHQPMVPIRIGGEPLHTMTGRENKAQSPKENVRIHVVVLVGTDYYYSTTSFRTSRVEVFLP